MVVTGYKKSLVREDLWHLNPEDRSQSVVPKFEIQWNKEVLKSQRYALYSRVFHCNFNFVTEIALVTKPTRDFRYLFGLFPLQQQNYKQCH